MQSSPRWLATIADPASMRVMFAADTACPGCGRSRWRSSAKTRSVPSWPSTLIAAAMSASRNKIVQVGEREHEVAEHSVGAVDQCQALLLGEGHRHQPVLGHRLRRRLQGAVACTDVTFSHHRKRDVGQAARGRRSSRGCRTRRPPASARRTTDRRRPVPSRYGPRCGRSSGSTAAAASLRGSPHARPRPLCPRHATE